MPIKNNFWYSKKSSPGWMVGQIGVKAGLRTVDANKKIGGLVNIGLMSQIKKLN